MLHKTSRAGKVPITVRNQLHLMLRRWQIFGPKRAFLYYGRQVLGPGHRDHDNPAPVTMNPTTARGSQVEQHFGLEPVPHVPIVQHSASAKWGVLYERSSETIFRQVMQKLPLAFENYIFIDLGAGKGFVLCLAAEFPFKKVIGVEYSNPLATAAAENLRRYGFETRKCPNVACVLGDATEFSFPPEPTVLYLYNPFQGSIMDRVLAKLKQSLRDYPRDCWIFYANPWEHRKFKRSREFEVIELTWDYALYRHVPDR